MKPGEKFTCPACGNAAFTKLEKILDGDFDTAMQICNTHRAKDESET